MAGYRGGGSSGESATYSHHFSSQDEITIFHSLSHRPSVWIVLSDGILVEASITYSSSSFSVSLTTALTGSVFYR